MLLLVIRQGEELVLPKIMPRYPPILAIIVSISTFSFSSVTWISLMKVNLICCRPSVEDLKVKRVLTPMMVQGLRHW